MLTFAHAEEPSIAFPLVPSPKKYLPFQGRFSHRQRPYALRYGYISAEAVVIAATAIRNIEGLAIGCMTFPFLWSPGRALNWSQAARSDAC